MAEIYRAVDMTEGQRSVAIKIFKTDIEADRRLLLAYSRECEALQRLDHPNIVSILGAGRDPDTGRRYLVLEWLETSLLDHVAAQPLAGWDTFYEEIGRPILEALSYAYGQNVLHRDLKPQNVLLTSDGVIKVADFGISVLRSRPVYGVTVADFRSEPYSPPEATFGDNHETRDVYSFAVLALACLADEALVSYDDVYRGLDEFDGPPEIAAVLLTALSKTPDDRPSNIVELKADLSQIQTDREAAFNVASDRPRCFVRITRAAEMNLRTSLEHSGIDTKKFVVDDLNEICGLKCYRGSSDRKEVSPELGPSFALYAAQYLYHAFIDKESRGFLVIHKASPWAPSFLEHQRESAWEPEIEFSLQVGSIPPKDGRASMDWIVSSLAEHEEMLANQERVSRKDKLFLTWTSILHAKSDVEQRREAPVAYEGFERDGNRLKLFTEYAVEDDLVGQPRLIEVSERGDQLISGEVDRVGDDFVVLWVEDEILGRIPHRGKLQFDTRASRQAIRRQQQAADAVRFRRCVRPELRDLLVDPDLVMEPGAPEDIEFVDKNLDENKKDAVRKALGTDSFLVVEGPPGTGKTRFITEVVIQTLRRDPSSRILVTSQTHVALDNALENIRRGNESLKLLRIGHRHDERVSPSVADLLLENRVDRWLASVRKDSETFLANYASDIGVNRAEIDLGMAAARLRAALVEM